MSAQKIAPRKCFNIQKFSTTGNSSDIDIVLISHKARAIKPVPLKRCLDNDYHQKSNPAKRLRADSKSIKEISCPVPSCSAFVEIVHSYTKDLIVQDEKKIADVHRDLNILESQYQAKRQGNAGIPLAAFQMAKTESYYSIRKQQLLKKIENIRKSSMVQHGREVGIQYICRYQDKSTTDDEKLAIILDFRGRFCSAGDPPIQQCNTMMCQRCNVPMFIRNEDGFLMCKTCCTTEAYSERVPYIGLNNIDDADSTAQASKKVSNFRDYLHLLQGKKTNLKLEADLPAMVRYIESHQPAVLPDDITVDFITKMLVHMGKRKYIKYMALLESRLRSSAPPLAQMSLQLENKFCSNFLMLVDPYERHKPPSRKHFMSYAYCGWQFCRIEKTPEFYVLFRLLKDPAKIEKQDETFAKICPEIGWSFESSAPKKL